MSFYNDASLVFLPSGGAGKDGKAYSIKPTNGDGDFTFSRGSNLTATRVDSNGLIEKGRENLLLQSNQFDTTWIESNASATSGQSGYDGSSDAWLLSKSAANGRIYQNASVSGVATYSIYAKAGTTDWLYIIGSAGIYPEGYFDLSNGVLGSVSTNPSFIGANIQDVGNGWYRCSITFNTSLTRLWIYPADGNNDTSGTSGSIYIQDAQLEQGLVATEYIESGASTGLAGILEDSPRFDYSGGASCPILLLEPSRTNLFKYSEYLNSGTYNLVGGFAIETTSINSPEGVQNVSLFTSANATSEQYLNANSLTVVNGSDYTLSVFAKKQDFDFIQLKFTGAGGRFSAAGVWFNISTGAVATQSSGVSGSIEDYGNGWYRCIATATATGDGGAISRVQLASADNTDNVTGNGSNGTYVFGGQFEEGSYPTSYIPNHSGGSVTRESDATSQLTYDDNFNSIALFMDITMRDVVRDGSFSNINVRKASGSGSRFFVYRNNSTNSRRAALYRQNNTDSPVFITEATTDRVKIAMQYNSSNGSIKVYVNGANALASTITDTDFDEFVNFQLSGEGGTINIHKFTAAPTTYTNAELATLTTI